MKLRIDPTVFGIALAALCLAAGPALAQCNLAPNSAFEQGGTSSFDGWGLVGFNSSAVLQVSQYPEALQSGSRAARVIADGESISNFATLPERTSIPVDSSTSYVVSARLSSSGGAQAELRVVEWNGLSLVQETVLATGGGSGAWVTLEGSVVTQPTTNHLSIRLAHNLSAGTFTWDDIALWRDVAGERCVDARHYVTQTTPEFRMCQTPPDPEPPGYKAICIDGHKNASGEFVQDLSHGARNFWSHNGDGTTGDLAIGDHKIVDGRGSFWRCFADVGEECGNADGSNAHYPPHTYPLSQMLPVLSVAPSPDGVTPGARMYQDWEPFDVRYLYPLTGDQSPPDYTVWNRRWAWVLDSHDFGGTVGVQNNLLMFEQEGIGVDPAGLGLGGGIRMERYFWVPGYSRITQAGYTDENCQSMLAMSGTVNATVCDGVYNKLESSTSFNQRTEGDFSYEEGTPFIHLDWW